MEFERFKGKNKGQGFITYYDKETGEMVLDFIITLGDCCQYVQFMVLKGGWEVFRYSHKLTEAYDEIWRLKKMPHNQCQNYYGWGKVKDIEVVDICSWHRLCPVEEMSVAM